MDGIRDMIAAERAELAEVLTALPAARWDEPTLCAGWRVREVVAHVTMPFRYSRGRFAFELVRSRGAFNAMADRCARRDAAIMSPDELAAGTALAALDLRLGNSGDRLSVRQSRDLCRSRLT